jgi:hypothetical protein
MQIERIEQVVQRSVSVRGARALAGMGSAIGNAKSGTNAGESTE